MCSPDLFPYARSDNCPRRSTRALAMQLGRKGQDRKSTRLNSSHGYISYAVFCLKKISDTEPVETVFSSAPSANGEATADNLCYSRETTPIERLRAIAQVRHEPRVSTEIYVGSV